MFLKGALKLSDILESLEGFLKIMIIVERHLSDVVEIAMGHGFLQRQFSQFVQ